MIVACPTKDSSSKTSTAALPATRSSKESTSRSSRAALHALMGPNGSGKSTLAFSLTGPSAIRGDAARSTLDGEDLLALPPDKRARAGLFLSFQYPAAIPGVKVANFLHAARQAERPGDLPPAKFRAMLLEKMEQLGHRPVVHGPLSQRRLLGRRKKAARDAAAGRPRAEVRDPRRNRFRASTSTRSKTSATRSPRCARATRGATPAS